MMSKYKNLLRYVPDQGINLSEKVVARLSKVDLRYANPPIMIAGAIYAVKYGDKDQSEAIKYLEEVYQLCLDHVFTDDRKVNSELVMKDIYRAYRYIVYGAKLSTTNNFEKEESNSSSSENTTTTTNSSD